MVRVERGCLRRVLLVLAVPAGLLVVLGGMFYRDNRGFADFTERMFREEITGNTLNLHYTLAEPASCGIGDYPLTLGDASPEALEDGIQSVLEYRQEFSEISPKNLSAENRLTYDILDSWLDVQAEGADLALYAEPLGPTIGTQAQLPVLLAEYAFREAQDVEEYLALLSCMEDYFASLLAFEQAKAEAGLFMSDRAVDAIISQCEAFTLADENFLIPVFDSKVDALEGLSQARKADFKARHEAVVKSCVLPAYQLLVDGLKALKGSGKNPGGLAYFPQGKEYYEYLVKDSTGCMDEIPAIEARIRKQLLRDYQALLELVRKNPEAAATASAKGMNPSAVLEELQGKMSADFPECPEVSYEVKFVHPSMENFLSPAFYLTPPVDDLSSNVIYVNNISGYTPLELYTTLAHEGYPGHLYQTVYSGSKASDPVRNLLNFGGYVEGWATYVEMYAYGLADVDRDVAEIQRLNRSVILGISSALDIAVHYRGYTREQTAQYLSQVGFSSAEAADSLYDTLLEAPGNYLKYYLGYLCFLDLRDAVKEKEGEDFDLKDFHTRVLEIGPAPFPVLEKYLLEVD